MVSEQSALLTARREELSKELNLLTPNVYFQAPSNTQMQYPCIRYEQDDADTVFANNVPYRITKRYSVTIMDYDPDSELADKVANMPMCVFNRHYVANELHHYVYNLFF